jgi:molecular chaperone DnaK
VGLTVGIDLGTTFSAIARINDLSKPEIIRNRDGDTVTPSVVLFQGDVPLVGLMAKRSAATAPLDVVQFVKRQMGDPSWRFDTTEGERYSPEQVSALILKRLKEDAEEALGQSVTDAVITVPAYFDDARRRATKDAGRIAGLNVPRVLNEPTAAALAYGHATQNDGTVLVYDLGGGTFDVTVLRITRGEFDILATGGDPQLGGFNWDNELMTLLNERFRTEGVPDLLDGETLEADLREKAELAKHSLTTVEKTRVALSADGVSKILPVSRADFEDATSSLLGRTRDIAVNVLEDAGLPWSAIDRLLLVGGSTRMPMVRTMIEREWGRTAERSINPDEVVALGAAIQAQLVEAEKQPGTALALRVGGAPVVISDVTSQGLGTIVQDGPDGRFLNSIIIPPNTKIPAKRSDRFYTLHDYQTEIDVQVTQGDDEDPDYVRVIGNQVLQIPPYPAGAEIEVVYAYDIDQMVFIEVTDMTTGRPIGTFEVANEANLTDEQVRQAALKMRATEVS